MMHKAKDSQSQGRTDLGMNSAKVKRCWRQVNNIAVIDIFNEKRKSCKN